LITQGFAAAGGHDYQNIFAGEGGVDDFVLAVAEGGVAEGGLEGFKWSFKVCKVHKVCKVV
jgi:hypothetical protein